MKRNKFVIAIVLIALLSAVFGAGGTKPALAEAAFLDDVAGISAWYTFECVPTLEVLCPELADFASVIYGVEVQTDDSIIGSVAIDGYADVYDPHVFVGRVAESVTDPETYEVTVTYTYWIMAYYLEDEPAAKMLDVIAQPVGVDLPPQTLLEKAVGTVGIAAGIDPVITPIDAALYDFSNPGATNMLFVAEDKAEDELNLGDDNYWFTLAIPDGTYYEISYAFYQNYIPVFSLDGINFVNTNADYIGGAPLGTIYGDLGTDALVPLQSYLFEVDTISYADAGYGALLITYSDALATDFVLDTADWVEAFALVAPSTDLTDLFTFDFAPAAFGKTAPEDFDPENPIEQPSTLALSWQTSAGATSYEYCIDEIIGSECDTEWISTGVNTSVTLSGLPYNAIYYWQVRAVNSYESTEANDGTWWSFATKTGAPAAFGKLSPTDGAIDVATSPLLDWADADGADYYEYCVVTDMVSCLLDTDWISTDLVSQLVVSLHDNEDYTWQVRAVNTAGATYANNDSDPVTSDFWSFSTVTSIGKTSPIDGTTGVNPRATLLWEAMPGATSYQYCVDTTDNDACNRWISAGTATSVTVNGLKYSTTYFWQVRAVTATGTTEADGGDWWTFITRDRKAPAKLVPDFGKTRPTNGAIDQLFENLVLDWEDVAKVGYYEYCIQDAPVTADDPCTNWERVYDSTATIETLIAGTTYYWQVRAELAGIVGYADDGVYWSFTTIAEPVIVPET